MKKSLSLLVAAAMTLSTSAVAFAADAAQELTTQQKFDALKEAGVLNGFPDGSAGLEKEMTRAEFAKVLTKLTELAENSAANVYSDVAKTHWAAGFIGAATEAGLLNGLGNGKFGPSGKVTVEQIAKVADLVAGIEPKADGTVAGTVSPWAKGFVAAAIEAGLIPELPTYQVNATRAMLVDVAYDLAQPEETVLKATEAKQSGAKKVTVKFNKEVTAEEKAALTYELKNSLTTYPVTATFAADNKSVDLAVAYLPAGDYTLTVKGMDALTLKVEDETAKKVDITATALQQVDGQDLGVKVYNQFGEDMGAAAQVTSYNVTKSKQLKNGSTLDLKTGDDAAAINDVISVTAIYPSAGLSVNKQLKVINGSSATSIKLDQVQPVSGDARISVKDGYVLPLTLTDAAGQKVALPNGDIDLTGAPAGGKSVTYAGLVFYVSDNSIVDKFTVTDGVIKFATKKAGTVYVTVTNGAAAASAQTSIVVNDVAKVKTFELGNSGKLIVKGEKAVLPFTAVDTYGAAIAAKDVDLKNVKFNAFGSEIAPVKNAKGELEFTFTQTGTTTIYVYVDGVLQTKSVGISVADVAVFKAVHSVDVATTLEVGAQPTINQDNILLVDNYGRTSNVAAGKYTVTSGTPAVVKVEDGKLKALATGTAEITVHATTNDGITDKKFTVTVIANSDIKSYAIDTIDTLFGSTTPADTVGYEKAVTLVGKTAGGTTVALKSTAPDFVTSSDESVLKVADNGTTVVGQKAGKSTVAAYLNGSKVAEREVTVSADAKVVKTVELSADEYSVSLAGVKTVTPGVTVKDQYGQPIVAPGKLLIADTSIATVTGGVVTGVKVGTTTVTYVASNGTTDTAVIVVNP